MPWQLSIVIGIGVFAGFGWMISRIKLIDAALDKNQAEWAPDHDAAVYCQDSEAVADRKVA